MRPPLPPRFPLGPLKPFSLDRFVPCHFPLQPQSLRRSALPRTPSLLARLPSTSLNSPPFCFFDLLSLNVSCSLLRGSSLRGGNQACAERSPSLCAGAHAGGGRRDAAAAVPGAGRDHGHGGAPPPASPPKAGCPRLRRTARITRAARAGGAGAEAERVPRAARGGGASAGRDRGARAVSLPSLLLWPPPCRFQMAPMAATIVGQGVT